MKEKITVIAANESYANMATFETVESLNETVRAYKKQFSADLNKTQRLVLDQLHRFSCKYIGVSFRTKNNIAETLKISRRTVIRACQHLESLDIIKQVESKRKSDMKQTSNIIIIQPIINNVTQDTIENDGNCHTKKTNSIFKTNTIKPLRTEAAKESLVNEIIPSWIPKEFAKYTSNFYQPKQIIEFARVALINAKKHDIAAFERDSIALEAFKQLVYKIKHSKVKNPFGLYTAIVRQRYRSAELRAIASSVFGFQGGEKNG